MKDFWEVVESLLEQCGKETGLTELAYGEPGGMLSAAEREEKK